MKVKFNMDVIYQPIHDKDDYTRKNRFTGESIELTKNRQKNMIKYFIMKPVPLLRTKSWAKVLANIVTRCGNYWTGFVVIRKT